MTADELLSSPDFLRLRIEQQAEYIAKFDILSRTRDDKEKVLESAYVILERFQELYYNLTHEPYGNTRQSI